MPPDETSFPRRTFIAGALAATAAACSSGSSHSSTSTTSTPPAASGDTTTSTTPAQTRFVSSGRRDRQETALTFHVSGDRDLAIRMLDLLRAHGVRITAFMVGSWLDANADLAARFVDDGHDIANHTYTHLTFPSLSRTQMTSEVDRCRDVLSRVVGNGGRFFRPSGTSNGTDDPGATVRAVAQSAGYELVVGFDVDPSDYADPGAGPVADRTLAKVQPGSIVSLHFGHAGTIEALPRIIDGLASRSLRPTTLTELLA